MACQVDRGISLGSVRTRTPKRNPVFGPLTFNLAVGPEKREPLTLFGNLRSPEPFLTLKNQNPAVFFVFLSLGPRGFGGVWGVPFPFFKKRVPEIF
jgi:hypothetical protein